ncbi:Uncharacterized protein ChrSV_3402 [Chromobacterium vaccinii]|nr:Uncharacterized protein ChrSW_3389 [Chromobacterium vaccinii]QND85628.1 Uncharacterized protein ChrSW_3402 [Chromobacterium vaccinii]QND90846.1 Uncharacterized protein ChrSV_3389 [Chromobacterium vaccinii]QND90859.1 Uncharacterized protein ChrSV_3402 [Chromobacterium vaccinii]
MWEEFLQTVNIRNNSSLSTDRFYPSCHSAQFSAPNHFIMP